MSITILARYTSNTYVARAKGHKGTASCTEGARAAAVALARKLGLDPALLQEQQNDLISPDKVMVFSHPGEVECAHKTLLGNTKTGFISCADCNEQVMP